MDKSHLMNLKENDTVILKNDNEATILKILEPGKTYVIDEIVEYTPEKKTVTHTIMSDEIVDQLIFGKDPRVKVMRETAKFLKENMITCPVCYSDILKMMKGDVEGKNC